MEIIKNNKVVSLRKHIRKYIKIDRKILKEATNDKILKNIFDKEAISFLLRSHPNEIIKRVNMLEISNKKTVFNTIRKYRNKIFIDMMLKNKKIIVDEECLN